MTIPENWTPPRELTRALPRETRMTGSSIAMAIVAALLLLGSIPLAVAFRNQNEHDKAWARDLREHGREASGRIVRLWVGSGKDHPTMVRYSFTIGGTILQADVTAPRDIWRGLRTNDTLPVRYVPATPYINHPTAWEFPTRADWVPFIPAAMIGGAGIVLLVVLRRQSQMVSEGVAAAGVVTKCSPVKGGWAVSYQFRVKDGTERPGSGQTGRRLDVGTAICVLYLPQNPRRNSMYPTTFYRVVQ